MPACDGAGAPWALLVKIFSIGVNVSQRHTPCGLGGGMLACNCLRRCWYGTCHNKVTVLRPYPYPSHAHTRIRATPVPVSVLRLCLYPYVRVGVYAVYIYAGSHSRIRT